MPEWQRSCLLVCPGLLCQGKQRHYGCFIDDTSLFEKAFWKVATRSQKGIDADRRWCFMNDGFKSYGPLQIDISEDRAPYSCRDQFRPYKVGAAKMSTAEVCIAEVCITKVSTAEIGIAEIGTTEVCPFEIGSVEVGLDEVCIAEVRLAEVSVAEVCITKVSTAEISSVEVGLDEVRIAEVGVAEVGVAKISTNKIGIREVSIATLSFTQISTTKVGSTKIGIHEGTPTEVGPAEIGSTKVGPAEIGTTEIGSRNRVFLSPYIPMLNSLVQVLKLLFIWHNCLPLFYLLFLSISYAYYASKEVCLWLSMTLRSGRAGRTTSRQ